MTSRKSKKLSDIIEDTNFALSRKGSFKEAFPEIVSAKLVVEESGTVEFGLYAPHSKTHKFDETNLGEAIDCSNPLCRGGGFLIGKILREMVLDRKTHLETVEICRGHEGAPTRRCLNKFTITADVEYRSNR